MLDSVSHIALFTATVVFGHVLLRKLQSYKSLPPPPGPPSYPLIGQLLSMPQSSEEREFTGLSAQLKCGYILLVFEGVITLLI
jgi:hypothetical protein